MKKKIIIAAALALLALFALVSCSKNESDESGDLGETVMVQIEMENGGIIKLELYPEAAPITVENFVKLVNEGFYDGLIFHRVIKDFMIQGGDPEGTGMGGSDTTIKGEFKKNGWDNPISHVRGVISMARSSNMDSASSQFFICHADSTYLDGQYAAFGKVVEGMDVVDEIASVPTDKNDRPLEDVVIKTITVIE
jgi:peptidyl-prolyl cis-trans isomerase B (cyclophilin B)